jgi:UDP-N-acetylglucosamine 3-dehydrogenase
MTFDFDFAGWLMGPPRRLVASAVSTPHGFGEISALLDYDEGRSATVLASGLMPGAYPFRVGFRALFETALIESEAVFSGAGPPSVSLSVYPQTGEPRRPEAPATNPYQVELERFVACVRGTADPALLDVDNALAALTLSIATQTSLSERRSVALG